MMRFARVASVVVIGLLAAAAVATAQPPVGADEQRFTAAFNAGASLGHKSSGAFGGEVTWKATDLIGVFVEGGRIPNSGTDQLDADAQKIANAVGATASASLKVNFFDVGVRVTPTISNQMFHPYLMFGIGVASLRAETALAVGGTTVTPDSLGVQFGSDLNGTESKTFITIGGGVTYPFAQRYFFDLSYRYGNALAKTSVKENDQSLNTQRVLVGIGIHF